MRDLGLIQVAKESDINKPQGAEAILFKDKTTNSLSIKDSNGDIKVIPFLDEEVVVNFNILANTGYKLILTQIAKATGKSMIQFMCQSTITYFGASKFTYKIQKNGADITPEYILGIDDGDFGLTNFQSVPYLQVTNTLAKDDVLEVYGKYEAAVDFPSIILDNLSQIILTT